MLAGALRGILVLGLAFLLGGLLVTHSSAGKFPFGPAEELRVIASTQLVREGTPLSLCYKAYTYYVLAGVYTTGTMVLCDGSKDRYWLLPAGEKVEELQRANLLPNPLPRYERPIIDYVLGYSLWLIFPPIIVSAVVFRSRRKSAPADVDVKLLRSIVRPIMARMIECSVSNGITIAIARATFLRMFNEPMRDEELAADIAWVREDPAAFYRFMSAAGRRLKKPDRLSLLRLAAALVMVKGELSKTEQAAIAELAECLDLSSREQRAVVDNLRQPHDVP